LCLTSGATTGWSEEPSNADERILRLEREVRMLHQKNTELERELRDLRQALEGDEEAALEAPREEVAESEEPAGGTQQEASPPAGARERDVVPGLRLTSDEGWYDLQLGGRVTGRFTAFAGDHPLDDEFSVERARLFANARLFEYYSLRIQVEFSQERRVNEAFSQEPRLKDGYLEVHYVPWARFRLGQFKVPFTLENVQSHKYIDFAERSIATDNMRLPSRDIGAMLHGRLADGRFEYQLAVLSGAGENRSDDNSAKDLAGRLVLRPFRRVDNEALRGAQLGISGTWGEQDRVLFGRHFLTVGGTEFVDFAPGTLLKGDRSRLAAEFAWPVGPALLKTEWMWMWLEDLRGPAVRGDFQFDAWYVSGSYLLTGEKKTLGRIVPKRRFNPFRGTWGAWELAARYSLFRSDDDLFRLGLASGTRRAGAFTVGISWYLNELLRLTLNYERTEFEDDLVIGGELLDEEDVLLLQTQLEF
jgi:phosphate-selective porin OprO/OprP